MTQATDILTPERIAEIRERATEYLSSGGLFNPEMMEHNKVRNLIMDSRDALDAQAAEIERLREALEDVTANPRAMAILERYAPETHNQLQAALKGPRDE